MAVVDIDRRGVGPRNPLDLVEAGEHQVHRQRRVAQRRRLLLAFAKHIVRERAKRLALRGVEDARHLCRDDHVRVARERVGARVGVVVHPVENLGEVVGRPLVRVDLRLEQRDRHRRRRRLDVVAGGVQDLRNREAGLDGIGVLDVGDRPLAVTLADVAGHTERPVLGLETRVARELRGEPARDGAPHLCAERVPESGMLLGHPERELRSRT